MEMKFMKKKEEIEMQGVVKAIEITGKIDSQHKLVLDEPIPVIDPTRVKVFILVPEKSDIDEKEWIKAASTNPAFDFLKDPEEDIYTINDGEPFNDQK